MKIFSAYYLPAILLILCSAFSSIKVLSQDRIDARRVFYGSLKDIGGSRPVAPAEVCERDRDDIHSAVSCVESEINGNFKLTALKSKIGVYWFSISANSESFNLDVPDLQIENFAPAVEVNLEEIRFDLILRGQNKTLDDRFGGAKSGSIEICRADGSAPCNLLDLKFPAQFEGGYDIPSPDSAFTVKIKIHNQNYSAEWNAIVRGNHEIIPLSIKIGAKFRMQIGTGPNSP